MKLVIDRNKWLRGKDAHGPAPYYKNTSALLRHSDNKMCCLGFYALSCGYSKEEIKGADAPSDVANKTNKNLFPKEVVNINNMVRNPERLQNTSVINDLMDINDDRSFSEEERERSIKEKFAEFGVEVEFVGGE